jgi:Fuc2NAc and GlcNAc transferase
MLFVSLLGSLAFAATLALTYSLIKYSGRLGMLDVPNERSSHVQPTPKGGGLAFFTVFTLICAALYFWQQDYQSILFPLFVGAPVVVLLGWLDDRRSLSAWPRLMVHFAVSVIVYALITNNFQEPMSISFLPDIEWVAIGFCLLFIAWSINLYNFMDGADGVAASTGMVGASLMAVVAYFHGAPAIAMIYVLVAYCLAGFLVFNWAPAQIFMGDTGSYFLGFVFASLALISKVNASVSIYSHIIIFGFFIFDATYTLFRRALRRERLFSPHKMFLFHKLIAKGWSHSKVATFYAAVIIVWLFPLSSLAATFGPWGMAFVFIAYLPILLFAIYHKAGEP